MENEIDWLDVKKQLIQEGLILPDEFIPPHETGAEELTGFFPKADKKTIGDIIEDKFNNISMGLEYPYRMVDREGDDYLIYEMKTGRVVEILPRRGHYADHHTAYRRLRKINNYPEIDDEIKLALDL